MISYFKASSGSVNFWFILSGQWWYSSATMEGSWTFFSFASVHDWIQVLVSLLHELTCISGALYAGILLLRQGGEFFGKSLPYVHWVWRLLQWVLMDYIWYCIWELFFVVPYSPVDNTVFPFFWVVNLGCTCIDSFSFYILYNCIVLNS